MEWGKFPRNLFLELIGVLKQYISIYVPGPLCLEKIQEKQKELIKPQ